MPNESQQLTTLSYVDFTGGMNSAVPPTSLQDNEYQLIRNMELNFNKLVTRGGLSRPLVTFPNTIKGMFYHEATGELLVVLNNKDVYHVSASYESTKVGEVVGSSKPCFCSFDGNIFIATGGKLQYYDYVKNSVVTIQSSYNCDNVFERFGRLATSVQGDDNIYYSAIGNPYEQKIVETTITDSNGNTTTTSTVTTGEVGTATETVETQSTSKKTTTISESAKVTYKNGTANVIDGTSPVAGSSTSKTQAHTVRVEQGYNGTELISTVYYLDNKQSTVEEIGALSYDDFIFGAEPNIATYLPVTDSNDIMYGSFYRDVADTSGNTTRTYYFNGAYDVYSNQIITTYKVEKVTSSNGSVTSNKLTIPYLRITLGEIPEEAFTDEADVIKSKTTESNITGGKRYVTNSTVVRIKSSTNGADAKVYYKNRTVDDVTTVATSSSNTTSAIVDDKGYKVGDTYPNANNITINSNAVKNGDGTATIKYSTVVNKSGKVTSVTKTITQDTSATSGNGDTSIIVTDTTTSVARTDNGTTTTVNTTTRTKTQTDTYTAQFTVFSITLNSSTTENTVSNSSSTVIKTTYDSGWTDDTNDDSSSKWLEVGYKDDGDILKVIPIAGDIAVFKTNGRVYSISNEYPDWTVQQIAEHTDVLNAEAIVGVGSNVAFMTNKGLKTLQTTAVYGNFTQDELARKINRSVSELVSNPVVYNLVRKRQLVIFPSTFTANKRSCYVYQYDVGAGMKMDFAIPIYDMQDTPNGVLVAGTNAIHMWSFDYEDDGGIPIQQEIVSKKYVSSGRLYTRMVDIGVEGTTGGLVQMKWANKVVNYAIPEKRRVLHVFSVCRDSVFGLYTTARISLEYIKLYIFEQHL